MQSRYYDPELGRFINADGLVSTGQGLLGYNMFAYCRNNPTNYCDPSGAFSQFYLASPYEEGSGYIYDQNDESVASMTLGEVTVSYGGCGAIASYNALISLGDYTPFSEILEFFNNDSIRLVSNGAFGILPWTVAAYFKSLGYNVAVAYSQAGIDVHSAEADACIMFYLFPRNDVFMGMQGTWPGGHFVEYSRTSGGFLGRNTGSATQPEFFASGSEIGAGDGKFYAIGIFIYK